MMIQNYSTSSKKTYQNKKNPTNSSSIHEAATMSCSNGSSSSSSSSSVSGDYQSIEGGLRHTANLDQNFKKPVKRKANGCKLHAHEHSNKPVKLTMPHELRKNDEVFDFNADDSSTTMSKLSDNYLDNEHQITYRVGG